MTKVLHIQYGMPPAGNAPYRLHCGMLDAGIDSSVLTLVPTNSRGGVTNYPETVVHKAFANIVNRAAMLYPKRRFLPSQYSFNEIPLIGKDFTSHHLIKEADVIYLHWVSRGVSIKNFRQLFDTGKPIVIFMHDMWDITGGCHHSFDCKQYQTGCKNCAMFKSGAVVARKEYQRKAELISSYGNITFVTPSQWLRDCASASLITAGKDVVCIPNYIDSNIFKPVEKSVARSILNLPQDKKIICFGCQPGKNRWAKGWSYLAESLQKLHYSKDEILLLVFGSDGTQQQQQEFVYPVVFTDLVYDEHKLILIDSAADVFVSPSMAESFGLTLLENILCNTPVVSFDNTAIPEIIDHEQTGYIARNKDSEDLAKGIAWALEYNADVRGKCSYTSSDVIQKHVSIISSLRQ